MKEHEAEARLARAMEDAAPNRLDELLEVREEARRQEKIVDISAPPRKKRRRWQNFAAAVAAALVLVIGGGSFFGWRYANAPDSLVDIDVNPSVQLTVSRNEKVLSCEALNADGTEIIDDMDLRGSPLNVAVNALIGSMVQHGYIDELKNSVLITVANEDAAKAQALQESLMADISGLLAGESVDAAVMGQTITTQDQTLASQAEAYGISAGKAALIQSVGSLPLLEAVEKEAEKQGIVQDILLEVNIGGEEAKSGFAPAQLEDAARAAQAMSHVRVRGLMTIPPADSDRDTNIRYFQEVRALYVDINEKLFHNELKCLSMGMSGDFEDAIRNGATMVRVGTAIFGARYYPT